MKKLDDLPKDYQEPDPYLDETVNIALDLAKLEKARPAEQPAPRQVISIRHKKIVPDFFKQRQDAVNQMLQNVKVVSFW